MRKILICFISFFLFLNPIRVAGTNTNYQEKFVLDSAKLLNKRTEDYILNNSKKLKETLNINYYLITMSSLNNQNIDIYINNLFNAYNFDQNTILILVIENERTIKVKVGKKLSNIISNKTIKEYLEDFFIPYIKNNQWNQGLKNGYSAFLKLIYENFDINNEEIIVKDVNNIIYDYKFYFLCAIIWISTILSYVLCTFFKKNLNSNKQKVRKIDTLIFSICIFANIIILLIANYLESLSVILIIIYELSLIKSYYKLSIKPKNKKYKSKGERK